MTWELSVSAWGKRRKQKLSLAGKYILDQIVRARYSGYWFVHAEMITNQRQGVEWQSVTNGDLFASSSTHGCYYHDTQNYIVILRY